MSRAVVDMAARTRLPLRSAALLVAVLGVLTPLLLACSGSAPKRAATRPGTAVVEPAGEIVPTPSAGWTFAQTGPQNAIEGYADHTDVLPGQPVRLFVSTTAPTYRIAAFRIGAYGAQQAGLVWRSATLPGHQQAAARMLAPTRTMYAPWRSSLMVSTDRWPAGDYLFTLTSSAGFHRWIPLTVRSPSAAGRVVLLNAVTTWQAYNAWGGYSLYRSPSGSAAQRARAVSFDRPYTADFGNGSADFIGNELPLVVLAERLHLPLAYATDVDLHEDPHLLDRARAVISLGHDEYYSQRMRDSLQEARDRGTNIAFLGANAIYRHIRLTGTPTGRDRLEIDYKSFPDDPVHRSDPAAATPQWRDPPVPRPESVLTGTFYRCNPVHVAMVAADTTSWLTSGLGLRTGTALPGLVGSEYDEVGGVPTPQPIDVLFHSPLTCGGKPDHADAAYYSTASGAGVFDSGTSTWVCALSPGCAQLPALDNRIVTAMTSRLLVAFSAGPAGRAHPASQDLAALGVAKPPAPPAFRPAPPDPVDRPAAEVLPTH